MRRILAIAAILVVGFLLDGAIGANIEPSSSFYSTAYCAELSAETMAQIECARHYNSDLKLPSTPSVTAPQYVERTLRNEHSSERRSTNLSQVRAACTGQSYISAKPLSRLLIGKTPSGYSVRMLCRLII